MCGIAGIHQMRPGPGVDLTDLKQMILALNHRGPDEYGLYRDEQTGLASARLSIIDLSGGQQPIGNEDGSLWIVFNGEIFNYVELRPILEARGHQFSTNSDTEVILHLYEEFGPACLQRLNGQFAIAIWDNRNKILLLARDRLGIRPLFVFRQGERLAFASEIKSFTQLPGWQARFNLEALQQIFTYWAPLSPATAFEGVEEIPPGHYLVCQGGEAHVEAYWNLDFSEDQPPRSDADYLEEFSALLIDATQIRLRADVPVGAYLSGGLDSSTTAAVIRQYTATPLDTFSIAFTTPQYNESEFQQRMARHLGTHHQVVTCTPQDIGRVFPDVIWHTETPILRTSPAPMFLLSDLVHRHHYKVVLTGEGADEFLGGYDIFKEMKIRRFVARHPESTLRPQLFSSLYPEIPRADGGGAFLSAYFSRDVLETASPYYSHALRWQNTARTQRFLAAPAQQAGWQAHLPETFSSWSPLAQAQYLEITTFMSPYLLSSQGDRPGMAHSVEGRFPFLDYRLVEFANRLPPALKLRGLNEKYLLRQFARRLLPAEIWARRKRPYRAPIQASFFGSQPAPYLEDLLSADSIQDSGLFNAGAVARLSAKARSEKPLSETEEMALVGIISTLLLHRQYMKGERRTNSSTDRNIKILDFTEEIHG